MKSSSLILGVTGGIGSGKSTVCRIFKALNVPVYNSDERAKFLADHEPLVKNGIISVFGNEAYRHNSLNRPFIAKQVFKNRELLSQLNQIIHPAVFKDFYSWKEKHSQHPILIKEAAILFESGAYKSIDQVLTVIAPFELRIERVRQRDKISRQQVLDRMKNQWNDEEKIKLSNFVVYCDEKMPVISQVLNIYNRLADEWE